MSIGECASDCTTSAATTTVIVRNKVVAASMEIVIMSPDFVRLWDILKRLREIELATHTHSLILM